MTTFHDAICAAVPGASDDFVNHVMWSRTAFPFKELEIRDVYRAASSTHRAHVNGLVLCDFCFRLAVKNGLCVRCRTALDLARMEQ